MRVTFSCLAKRKSPKRKRPHCLRPLRFATGQPAVLGFGGVSLNSRRCASLRHTRALIRQTLRSSAHPEGHRGTEQPHGPLLRSAPSRGCKRHALRSLGRAQQWPVGPFGCSAVPPLLAAPAAGRLWGGTRVGARVLRALTRRGCPSGARQRKASSTAHPATAPTQVCPGAKRRGRRLGVAFSLVTFSWRSKRKLLARRATPGLHPQHRQAAQSAQRPDTTKSIATSPYPTSASSQNHPNTPDTSLTTRSHRHRGDRTGLCLSTSNGSSIISVVTRSVIVLIGPDYA